MNKRNLEIQYQTEFYSNDIFSFVIAILQSQQGGEIWIGNHFKMFTYDEGNLIFRDELDVKNEIEEIIEMKQMTKFLSGHSSIHILEDWINEEQYIIIDNNIKKMFYGYDKRKQEVYGLEKKQNAPLQSFTMDYITFEREFKQCLESKGKISGLMVIEDIEDADVFCDKDTLIESISNYRKDISDNEMSIYGYILQSLDEPDCYLSNLLILFQKLYEHKWAMYLVINYYCRTSSDVLDVSLPIFDEYTEIKDTCKNFVNLLNQNTNDNWTVHKEKIQDDLKSICLKEIDCLQDFIHILKITKND